MLFQLCFSFAPLDADSLGSLVRPQSTKGLNVSKCLCGTECSRRGNDGGGNNGNGKGECEDRKDGGDNNSANMGKSFFLFSSINEDFERRFSPLPLFIYLHSLLFPSLIPLFLLFLMIEFFNDFLINPFSITFDFNSSTEFYEISFCVLYYSFFFIFCTF